MIDQRAFQQVKTAVEALRLGHLDPILQEQLSRLRPDTDDPLDNALWPHVLARYEALAGDYETTGIVKVPPALLPEGFPVALQDGTGAIANISANGNVILAGPSGSGKTTLQQNGLLAAYNNDYQLFIIDSKRDSAFWLALDASFQQLDGSTPIPLLERPEWRTVDEHITELVEWFRRCFYSGEQQGAVLRKALTIAFASYEHPSLAQVHHIIDTVLQRGTPSWRDAALGVSERFHKIKQRYRVAYETSDAPPLSWLLRQHLYLPMMSLDPVGEWAASIFLNHLFQRNKHYGIRHTTTIVAIDESIGLLSKAHAASGITGTNGLAIISTMNREFGIRIFFTTVDLASTDPLVLSTVATIGLLPGVQEQSMRLAGLTTNQYASARHLRLGQVLFLYPGQLPWPVPATFNPLPAGLKDLRPPAPLAQEPLAPTTPGATAMSPLPSVPSATHDDEVALNTADNATGNTAGDKTIPSNKIALNKNESVVMHYLGEHGVALVSDIFEDTGLHRVVVNRILQRTHDVFGFTASERVSTGIGSGKHGDATSLSPAGYEWLGIKPHMMRGNSSVEHYYWCSTIARHLGGHLETMVGAKSCDIIIKYDSGKHATFLQYVLDHGQRLTDNTNTPTTGNIIAIEVECNPEKTALSNAVKNHDLAHIPLTIIAVTGDPRDTIALLKAGLDVNYWPTILVVPILMLVDLAREPRREPKREKRRRKMARRNADA